jgi:hypothetical protein
MGHTPRTLSCNRRFSWTIILILCLACIAISADAASTRGLPTTTTPVFQVQQTVALVTATPQTVTCPAGCECMERSRAIIAWGSDGFTQCAEKACGYSYTAAGAPIEKNCLKQKTITASPLVPFIPLTTTITYPHVVAIPVVTTTTKGPVQPVPVNPNLLCAEDDKDCDGWPDATDNCFTVANPQQIESDSYILWSTCSGNACKMPSASDLMNCEGSPGDPLYENCMKNAWAKANPGGSCFSSLNCQHATDYYGDACDNCWEILNQYQIDLDGDCKSFKKDPAYWDGTQWLKDPQCGDGCDRCPGSDDSIDTDHDGVPDGCDKCHGFDDHIDTDKDGVADGCDNCPQVWNPNQKDTDKDMIGDMCQDPCTMNINAITNFSWTTWRDTNWMTPVRDQRGCGSCWAFSTVGATEARYNIEHGKHTYLDLSEQELVSPCYGKGDAGDCTGGKYPWAIGYVISNGLVDETDYPYLSWDEVVNDPNGHLVCKTDKSHCSNPESCQDPGTTHRKLTSSGLVAGTVQDVKQALLCHGPLVVASKNWWHAIVLTGWDDTTGAWQIKNSWGSDANWTGYGNIAYTGDAHSDIINQVVWVQGVTGP